MDEMAKAWGFDGTGEFCHGGMLNAADCIAKDLYRHQVRTSLHRTLEPPGPAERLLCPVCYHRRAAQRAKSNNILPFPVDTTTNLHT